MSAQPARPYLGIGEVLAKLRGEFPDISVSKIRFLESEGLLAPERTASKYRRFSAKDLERLRSIDATSHICCIVYLSHEEMKKNATEVGVYDFIGKGEASELRDSFERLMGLERG